MSDFPKRLRQLRLEHNLVQRELAMIAEVKLRAYQLYEQGKTEPSIDTLIKFADVFHVSLDDLVGREFIPYSRVTSAEECQTNLPSNPNV